MKKITYIIILASFFQQSYTQKIVEKDFSTSFLKYGVDGCFVMYNESDNELVKYHSSLCDSGYIPASTFKIPHSLIALEEGVVRDTNEVIKWDSTDWPVPSWNQDQTLKTAMKYSCVWVYKEFATKISPDTYNRYTHSFGYGNEDLTGPPTHFWLAGKLRITACQQVDFLRKFYHYDLPVSKHSIDMVKGIIVLEETDTYRLSGKTGGGMLNDKDYIMWLVGYLEKGDRVYFYAMNFISDDYNRTKQGRYDITKAVLKELTLTE